MVVAINAQAQDTYPPRVLLTLTGLTPGDLLGIFRVVAGERTLLRGGETFATGTTFLILDAELPFGVPVSYFAEVGSADYTTSSVTYNLPDGPRNSKVAFTDATTGLAAEGVIVSWPSKSRDREASTFVLATGKRAVVQGPRGQFSGPAEVFTDTDTARRAMETLLAGATGGVIQVRQGGDYSDVDCYVAVLGDDVKRFSQDGTDQRRLFTLQLVEVEPWAAELESRGYTYADLIAVYSGALDYSDLNGDYATYLLLAQAELVP